MPRPTNAAARARAASTYAGRRPALDPQYTQTLEILIALRSSSTAGGRREQEALALIACRCEAREPVLWAGFVEPCPAVLPPGCSFPSRSLAAAPTTGRHHRRRHVSSRRCWTLPRESRSAWR